MCCEEQTISIYLDVYCKFSTSYIPMHTLHFNLVIISVGYMSIWLYLANLSTENLVSISSAIIAGISALIAWHSARRTLYLAELDHKEKHETIKIYLIDSVFWQNENVERFVSFACRVTNSATVSNTITKAIITIHGYDESGNLFKLELEPLTEESPNKWNLEKLPVPINFEPRTTKTGWISFKIPKHFIKSNRVDKYVLSAFTSYDKCVTVETYLPRRLKDEDR